MAAGWGEFNTPANTLSGAPGATARLRTGLAVGATPWANAQPGNATKPNNIEKPYQPHASRMIWEYTQIRSRKEKGETPYMSPALPFIADLPHIRRYKKIVNRYLDALVAHSITFGG